MNWEPLYRSMEERWRPEDVARASVDLCPHLADVLRPACRGAYYGTRNFDRWGRPGFSGHSVNTSIVNRYPGLPNDAKAAVSFLTQATGLYSDDLRDRIPRPLRKAAGITISRRQYMKRCRILIALRRKLARVLERGQFVRWARIAQSGWSVDISMSDFMALTPETRVFVAYYVARKQRQSTFSGTGQDKAWDRVSDALFGLAIPSRAVALAYPNGRVLSELTDKERGELLIGAYRDLHAMAKTMRDLWTLLGANRETMIVRRGMNSSDWNAVAGAWNSVRMLWIALLHACGRDSDLDSLCPGKAMRLMAADVAAWHRSLGDDEGPDVKIFKQLPLPWDVVLGRETCTREDVLVAQRLARISKDTWTTPFEPGTPVPTKITRALVHGVAVSDPELADLLRRAKWFSGKPASWVGGVEVDRDEDGFALGVSSAKERSAR